LWRKALIYFSIIGFYVSVIFVIGRLLRLQTVGTLASIQFTAVPYVERIYRLCEDIYTVRESRKFDLEEILFSKLLFLYRSPDMMREFTKMTNERIQKNNDVIAEYRRKELRSKEKLPQAKDKNIWSVGLFFPPRLQCIQWCPLPLPPARSDEGGCLYERFHKCNNLEVRKIFNVSCSIFQ